MGTERTENILLRCRDLALGYEGTRIVENLNFDFMQGAYLFVVGENGSGKSTLIKTLLHLRAPLAGTITADTGLRRGDIGYLPQQNPVQRDFPASVREIVRSGCLAREKHRPFYSKEEKIRAEAAMEKLGIAPLATHCYRELSGGQQQRVLLARALCAAKKLLVLDEPVAGLDPVISAELYALIAQLNMENGLSVVMVSHDIPAAVRYASHILHIGHDQHFFGTTAEYLASPIGQVFADPEGGGPL